MARHSNQLYKDKNHIILTFVNILIRLSQRESIRVLAKCAQLSLPALVQKLVARKLKFGHCVVPRCIWSIWAKALIYETLTRGNLLQYLNLSALSNRI